ncbi:hypothetical protein BT67DRAFT_463936 [Trichocladium antarcticum]|uniref:gamma-glutamylcyclotransferase n=1 Tax=Trichocladium antarcticum TaxID=1450529 RepID=A0AAN6UFS3_9PEZI|nr:hypothetical protein BT67DRAFT_463936 [Trichocladium antarcticum]
MARGPAPLTSDSSRSQDSTTDDTAIWSIRHIQILWSWALRPSKSKPKYPPISCIPRTSVARLAEPDVSPSPFPSEPILAKSLQQNAPSKPKTVLYLAYGSNMCAETFLGMRGIRPLSVVNVSAPALDLTFDLPGIPYREPCFANTALRKIPGIPPLDPPSTPPEIPDHPPLTPPTTHTGTARNSARRPAVWNRGLYGVVYEVTAEDYAKIVATEGGGASYHDILVPCFLLPPSMSVPEKPTIPVPPAPFLAHTLYAPPGGNTTTTTTTTTTSSDTSSTTLPSWLQKLLVPTRRPSADYAQPSARYLKLLRDGAAEHELPVEYQAYLGALQPYTITTGCQRLGRALFLGFWAPLVILIMVGGRVFADETGRSPPWLVGVSTVVMNLVWASYDSVGKGVFGDGERTIDEAEEGGLKGKAVGFASGLRGKEEAFDEEKRGLLDGYDG